MKKGLLKINVPEECSTCPCVHKEYDWLGMLHRAVCNVNGKRVEVYCGENRPGFCPIEVEDDQS